MKKIAILLSGGVDSLVAAQLLKEQGFEIFGIHFITGYEKRFQGTGAARKDDSEKQISDHREIASVIVSPLSRQLGVPVKILDCSHAFQTHVVDYFIRTYRRGMTPSPCMVCNPAIKFETALSFAKELGATHLATGHYACTQKDNSDGYRLFKGKDVRKDQSYFLARLDQKALAAAVFPLCGMTKSDTLQLAKTKGLRPVVRKESQDICFIKDGHYGEFLMAQPGFNARPGLIENTQGDVIGEHAGLHRFTIGQRKGINCPASEPYYVMKIDTQKNKLIVGFKQEGYSQECLVEDINWIHRAPESPLRVDTRIRYRHQAAPSELIPKDYRSAIIKFEKPQHAITPGQAAVFYDGDEILGSGWIVENTPRIKYDRNTRK
jgi:tRNA-specific 2-thiouridylase